MAVAKPIITAEPQKAALSRAPESDQSPVLTLFRLHRNADDQARTMLSEVIQSYLSRTAADFAAKVVVQTCEGQVFPDWQTGELWKEARTLIEEQLRKPALPSLRALYSEWSDLSQRYAESAGAPQEVLYGRIVEIENIAADLVPETVEEFALKILFADGGGDMDVNTQMTALRDLSKKIALGA